VTVDDLVTIKLSAHISFQFKRNGHILGSCFVDMDCYGKKIVFSGDIGRYRSDFFEAPTEITGADYVFMESTYGDRLHDQKSPAIQLAKAILDTYKRHGNILIPAFAVGRAQEVMKILSDLKRANQIPYSIPVYLDSPMAADATDILSRYPAWHKLSQSECANIYNDTEINREFKGTKTILADKHHSKIIIAASGMITGGRVLEYMKNYAPDKRNSILLIGFQAEGTRGRALAEGEKEVKIHGQLVSIKAKVIEISGLSAHGDQAEMLLWLKGFKKKPKKVFLIHGEADVMIKFKQKIKTDLNISTYVMPLNAAVQLFKTE